MLNNHTSTAYLEVANLNGLQSVPVEKRDPFINSSAGVGQAMRVCYDDYDVRNFVIGSGGSAFSDGGFGAVRQMAIFDFMYQNGEKIGMAADLPFGEVHEVSRASVIDQDFLDSVSVLMPCDVTSPLLGPTGAAHVFGP